MICNHIWATEAQECGCVVQRCTVCTAAREHAACANHHGAKTPIPAKEYYHHQVMGCISEEGIPYNKGYISEMNIALAAMDARLPLGRALEIGAGNGRLIPYFLRRGNAYEALELSDWACRYVTECFDVPAHCTPFCDYDCEPETYDLILAFHSLEHMADAEQAFEKIASLLKPGGMFLYGGPAGTDLVNPDHVWFWEEPALRFWLESVGLHVQAVHHTTIQPHEDTLYAIAVR